MENKSVKTAEIIEGYDRKQISKTSDFAQPGSSEETISSQFVQVKFAVEKKHKTVHFQTAQLPRETHIQYLKDDMAVIFNTPGKQQEWLYKGSRLHNDETLNDRGVKSDDYISVKSTGD